MLAKVERHCCRGRNIWLYAARSQPRPRLLRGEKVDSHHVELGYRAGCPALDRARLAGPLRRFGAAVTFIGALAVLS